MVKPAPKIDSRTAAEIAAQVRSRLAQYTGKNFNTTSPDGTTPLPGTAAALVNIFARYCEIIIQRLNQVPNKNFLAFLDLLGASRLPPQPARVPLTFTLAAGSVVDAIVPAGTQVAAPPVQGETEPILFETERELVVTTADLDAVFVRDLLQDRYGNWDHSTQTTAAVVSIFEPDQPIEHIFYIGDDIRLSQPFLAEVRLQVTLEGLGKTLDLGSLQWEIWDGENGILIQSLPQSQSATDRLTPQVTDTTANLTKNGEITLHLLPSIPQQLVNGVRSRWLRCRLKAPINPLSQQAGAHLPKITELMMQTRLSYPAAPILAAIANQGLIDDPALPFYPFSERPKIASTLYLKLAEAEMFAAGGTITLTVNVDEAGISPNGAIQLVWKYWDGQQWRAIEALQDGTNKFTIRGAKQQVSFTLDRPLRRTEVNGISGIWLRIQIGSGDYGSEPRFAPILDERGQQRIENGNPLYQVVTPRLTPPLISGLTVAYDRSFEEATPPAQILTYNNFIYSTNRSGTPFFPFELAPDQSILLETVPTLYLGFLLATGQSRFPSNTLSLYCQLMEPQYEAVAATPMTTAPAPLKLAWEYWDGQTWRSIAVRDETLHLTRSGLVEFLPPQDFQPGMQFGQNRYWLRVRWEQGKYAVMPRLRGILLNTTIAAQTVTITNEILGSSDGSENQRFRTTQIPVLAGQQLHIRERDLPSVQEQATIQRESSPGATDQTEEIWVSWQEVSDFYASGARDRHYVLNHLTGEIQFGNGLNGLIPSLGVGNVRMTSYQSGGGTRGNRPAGTIVQLKTTIPYVEGVTNLEPATGGADAESIELMCDREPRKLRHNNRAVTLEDYEDLAMLASPAVARSKCTPLLNLLSRSTDTASKLGEAPKTPGNVSVIIVPHSSDLKPLPTLELINRVQDYLQARSLPTVKIAVVGPLYIQVSVKVELVLTSVQGASRVEQAVEQRLTQFLHPLTGGFDQTGWAFGREPYKSDFYRLIEAIPGVGYIRHLEIDDGHDQDNIQAILKTKRFLVYSGKHKISVFFDDDR